MAKVIAIMGESGSGKTTSMRNLDPAKTYYIDADRKGLSWKGWRSQYNSEAKNYVRCDDVNIVRQYIKKLSESCPQIKYIVVDTINGLMVADEMRRSKEKGYDKWVDLATCVWDLVVDCYNFRDDLTIIFTAHTQTETDDSGYRFTRIQTSGKKLNKIVLESKFTTVLLSKCVDGKYLFETRANNSTAKTPMGAFEDFEIENDIVKVIEALEEF
ncbi:ATP-binding protein [Lachnospiraceae bacterium]|nr:ATP-binding protein [Lachnospiraceae bacterium]